MDLKRQAHNLRKMITSFEKELLDVESRLKMLDKEESKEAVLPHHWIDQHVVHYRPYQVRLSLPCHGTKVQVGTRMALLQPICEFDHFSERPESKFYPGTVTELIGDPNDPMMKFEYDGGPNGSPWIMCGVKEYISYCIPVPLMYEQMKSNP